jgi:hypothetical protein
VRLLDEKLRSTQGGYTIGRQDTRKTGSCFVVVQLMGARAATKVLDRFPMTEDGWSQAWAALVERDPGAATALVDVVEKLGATRAAQTAETERLARLYDAFVRGTVTTFRTLGVQVLASDGNVYTIGRHDAATKTNASRLLGPLAGAQAMVTDGAQAWSPGRAMLMPLSLAVLATKTTADAAVVFPDGTAHIVPVDGNNQVREAQKQVVQFNALAGAVAVPASAETAIDPAVRLRKLRELLDTGLMDQEEYEAKRAEIINSI